MTSLDRFNHYKQSVSLCESLLSQLLRDDAFAHLGRERWYLLREVYAQASAEKDRRRLAYFRGTD